MARSNYWWLGAGVLALSAAARVISYPIVVSDYTYFVSKWFSALGSHQGLTAFQTLSADYAPLYLYLLKLLTVIPVSSLYSTKTLSFAFDVLIALGVYLILRRVGPRHYTPSQLFFCFALMLSIPTMLINSSLWDQSDSLYTAGVIFSLYAFLIDAPLWAAIAFGIALSFKIQAIFFLPIFVGLLLRYPPKYLWYLAVPPLLFILSVIPAWLGGGSFGSELTIYFHQATEYPWLDVSSQSLYAFTNNVPLSSGLQGVLFWIGIGIAGLCSLGFIYAVAKKTRSPVQIIYLTLLCVLIIPYFLPRMHERYFYMGDICSVLYGIYRPKQWFVPVLIILISFLSYMPFLAKQVSWFSTLQGIDLRIPATMLGLVLIYLLFQWKRVKEYRQMPALRRG